MKRKPKFDIYEYGGRWHWCLLSSNGNVMAASPGDIDDSTGGYETKAKAIKSCEWLMDNIERSRIFVDGKEVA